jgi:hypothetical protein
MLPASQRTALGNCYLEKPQLLPRKLYYPLNIHPHLFVLFPSQHNNYQILIHISLCIMNLLVLIYDVLEVSAYKSIIGQYTLTDIFKLLNCPFYEFVYYNIINITNVLGFLFS